MSVLAAFMILIPPPAPPYGPIRGNLDCMVDTPKGQEPAWVRFDESGSIGQGMLQGTQVEFTQFPLNGSPLGSLEFDAKGNIAIYAEGGKVVLGRFTYLGRGRSYGDNASQWMRLFLSGKSGVIAQAGICFGSIHGRADRPIKLTKIMTVRVD